MRVCAWTTLSGGEYARFMGVRRFNPSDRPPVRFVDDEELAYVATRSREVHDVWHVLFDCPTTVELGARHVTLVICIYPRARAFLRNVLF